MPNVNIGGHIYQQGSDAAELARKLYGQWQASQPSTAVPFPSVPSAAAPVTPQGTSYATPGGIVYSRPPATGGVRTGGGSASVSPGGASLSPAPATSGHGAYGLVPQIPNPVATASTSITGNQSNLSDLSKLGTDTTTLNANLGAQPYQMNLPNYQNLIGQSSADISSNLAGVIDPNEWAQLQTNLAERGASIGISPDSPNFNTALMRALDQSVSARQNLGQQQLNAAIARTPTGQPFNVAGQQVTPGDLQAAQYAANVAGAAPDPTMAAQANLDSLLKSIEAGRAGALGGAGGAPGGGGGRLPSVSAPGSTLSPVNNAFPTSSTTGFSPRPVTTAPGTVPPAKSLPYYGQNPNVDYSVGPDGKPYPVDLSNGFQVGDEWYDPSTGQFTPISPSAQNQGVVDQSSYPGYDSSTLQYSDFPGAYPDPFANYADAVDYSGYGG